MRMMANALTLQTNPMSREHIARWMLEEIGATYEARYLRFGEEMRAASFRALNPVAKFPVITHGTGS